MSFQKGNKSNKEVRSPENSETLDFKGNNRGNGI